MRLYTMDIQLWDTCCLQRPQGKGTGHDHTWKRAVNEQQTGHCDLHKQWSRDHIRRLNTLGILTKVANILQTFSNALSSEKTFVFEFMMTSSNGNVFRVTGHLCGEFTGHQWIPAQRPVTRSFDVFFDLRLNKLLSKQSWGWCLETLSRPLWRHSNVLGVNVWGCYRSTRNNIAFYDVNRTIFLHKMIYLIRQLIAPPTIALVEINTIQTELVRFQWIS